MGNSPKGEYMPKKINRIKMLGIGVVSLFLLGCSNDSFLLTEEESQEVQELVGTKETFQEQTMNSDESEELTNKRVSETEVAVETKTQEEGHLQEIAVHICGAVVNSGVFFLENGQRVCHAIEAAGGFKEEAAGDYINQALLLEDGMKIVIPTKEEVELRKELEEQNKVATDLTTGQVSDASYVEYPDNQSSVSEGASHDSQKVDLNTADETLLCTLPGIGTSRAKSIIEYRMKNGNFKRIEDVMKVSGIKEAAFDKIRDKITVSN